MMEIILIRRISVVTSPKRAHCILAIAARENEFELGLPTPTGSTVRASLR
jgi:hypothetical protein